MSTALSNGTPVGTNITTTTTRARNSRTLEQPGADRDDGLLASSTVSSSQTQHPPSGAPIPPIYLPGGQKSLSGISGRAFILGLVLGFCIILTIDLALLRIPLWRAPFFIGTLSLFHYLEFDLTARFNPLDAKVDSFLLTNNGSGYTIAHTAALTELLVRSWLFPTYAPSWLISLFAAAPGSVPVVPSEILVTLGVVFIVMGQYVRAAAMAQAGKSFNHIVQSTRKDDHVLVTSGIYAFSRHPSYFGFFWWGLGTQLVLGNWICLPGYALVLWKFFVNRIASKSTLFGCLLDLFSNKRTG